jgi:tRNA G10  N-methylase Trm11
MYLYNISYANGEDKLFQMEMRALFDFIPEKKYFFRDDYFDVNRSPFIKSCIDIKLVSDSLEDMINQIKEENISYDEFKVKYIDTEGDMEFNEKHRVEGVVGYVINGYANVHSPEIILGLTYANNKWILGEYLKNDSIWRIHNNRPRQYSNALSTKISRAIVNIAAGKDIKARIVDPCCGIGTVVMEGLSMGVDIRGYDINPKVVEGARENLKYFDYSIKVEEGDIREIKERFDAAIVDIPYGLLSITTKELQREIIKSARRISDKFVLVSLDDMDEDLKDAGFVIIDKCTVLKRDFKRHITLCR